MTKTLKPTPDAYLLFCACAFINVVRENIFEEIKDFSFFCFASRSPPTSRQVSGLLRRADVVHNFTKTVLVASESRELYGQLSKVELSRVESS
jgi:hypothetical protein